MMGEGGLALSWRVEDGKLVMRSGDEYIYFDRAGESEKPPAALAGNMFTGVWKGTVNGETITALGDENGLAMMQDGQTVMFFSFGKKGFTMMAGGQTMAISFSKNELAVSENGQAVTLFSFTKNEFTMMFREETIGFFIEDGKLAAQFDGRRILFDRIGG
jgi:hypothetical protein